MIITFEELNTIVDNIFEKSKKCGYAEFKIDEDYYWDISFDKRQDVTKKPIVSGIGSLYDDYDWLEKILSKRNPPITIDFERIGNLLIFIGEKLSKSSEPELIDDEKSIVLTLKFVRKIFNRLFKNIKISGFESFEFDNENYWNIISNRFEIYVSENQVDVRLRSIKNDFESLKELLNSRKLVPEDFVRIGNIMILIGYEITMSEDKIYLPF